MKPNHPLTDQPINNFLLLVNRLFGYSVIRFDTGITLLEVLLIVALIAIIGLSASPFLSNFILRNSLDTTTDQMIGSLRKAQQYALDGKNNVAWGVCLTGGAIRMFASSCASPTVSEQYTVPPGVTVSGLSTLTFESQRGEPSAVTTITVSTTLDSKTISVNAAGGMDIN